MLNIYVRYDLNSPLNFHTCVESIIATTHPPYRIIPLTINYLLSHGFSPSEEGLLKFLPPTLTNFKGWAIYLSDKCVVTNDLNELINENTKMDRALSFRESPLENSLDVIVFNCEKAKFLTLKYLTENISETGLRLPKDKYMPLPQEYNYMIHYEEQEKKAKIVNYGAGMPISFTQKIYSWDSFYEKMYNRINTIEPWEETYKNSGHSLYMHNKIVPRFMIDEKNFRPKENFSELVYQIVGENNEAESTV